MEKARVLTSVIVVILRVYKVIGLSFPLLLPEVHHHAPLQLQLEAVVVSRVRLHLLLRTRISAHAVVFVLVRIPGAHERNPALLAAPGGALAHHDAQQLCRVDVLVLHALPPPPAMTKVRAKAAFPPASLPGVPADAQRNFTVQMEAQLAQHLAVQTASWGAALERESACVLLPNCHGRLPELFKFVCL